MSSRESTSPLRSLDLPAEFEDLEGLLRADMRAIVVALSQRANERLLLTRREYRQLQTTLWNNLAGAVNEAVEPLAVEAR